MKNIYIYLLSKLNAVKKIKWNYIYIYIWRNLIVMPICIKHNYFIRSILNFAKTWLFALSKRHAEEEGLAPLWMLGKGVCRDEIRQTRGSVLALDLEQVTFSIMHPFIHSFFNKYLLCSYSDEVLMKMTWSDLAFYKIILAIVWRKDWKEIDVGKAVSGSLG